MASRAARLHPGPLAGKLMDVRKPSHVIAFAVACGVLVWMLSVLWSALFIVAIPMDPDWCLETAEVQTGPDEVESRCVTFKNVIEEAKYRHNVQMLRGNARFNYCMLALGGALRNLSTSLRQLGSFN